MKTKELGQEFTPVAIEINPDKQNLTNQNFLNDLMKIKQVVTTVPAYIPRKLIDQFQIVLTGGNYYLYIYCQDTTPGTWKKVTIS